MTHFTVTSRLYANLVTNIHRNCVHPTCHICCRPILDHLLRTGAANQHLPVADRDTRYCHEDLPLRMVVPCWLENSASHRPGDKGVQSHRWDVLFLMASQRWLGSLASRGTVPLHT